MRATGIHISLLLIAAISFSTGVIAQVPETESQPRDSMCQCCVDKLLQLPNTPTAVHLQDVMNTLRTILEVRFVYPDVAHHAIYVVGTGEQIDLSAKLAGSLDSLTSSGDRKNSVVVNEPQGAQPAEESSHVERTWRTEPRLSSSYVKAFYIPNSSPAQMMTQVTALRQAAQIQRIQILASIHVVVVRGSSEQIAQADSFLMKE